MSRHFSLGLLPLLLLASSVVDFARVHAAEACARCCQRSACCKVCVLESETKKVEITCWGCKSEDFCMPGRSIPNADHCQMIDCGASQSASTKTESKPKRFLWTDWTPRCATVMTKKKLMKRTVIKEIPTFKWVAKELCDVCNSECIGVETLAQDDLPAVPQELRHLPKTVEPQAISQLSSGASENSEAAIDSAK